MVQATVIRTDVMASRTPTSRQFFLLGIDFQFSLLRLSNLGEGGESKTQTRVEVKTVNQCCKTFCGRNPLAKLSVSGTTYLPRIIFVGKARACASETSFTLG